MLDDRYDCVEDAMLAHVQAGVMRGGDDLHAAIAVQICSKGRWQHVLVLQQGRVVLQVVVPVGDML